MLEPLWGISLAATGSPPPLAGVLDKIGLGTLDLAGAARFIDGAIRCKGVEKRTNADGTVSYVAKIGALGTQFLVR